MRKGCDIVDEGAHYGLWAAVFVAIYLWRAWTNERRSNKDSTVRIGTRLARKIAKDIMLGFIGLASMVGIVIVLLAVGEVYIFLFDKSEIETPAPPPSSSQETGREASSTQQYPWESGNNTSSEPPVKYPWHPDGSESSTPQYPWETGYYSRLAFWVPNGKSYHFSYNCPTLARSKTILAGTVQEAINAGKDDPCNVCANGA